MRRIVIGMALSLVLVAAVACSGDGSATEAPALPTSTPPVARVTQAAIAPGLQDKEDAPPVASESGPATGGVFNTLWSDPPTMDPHLVTDRNRHRDILRTRSTWSRHVEPVRARPCRVVVGTRRRHSLRVQAT